MVVMRVMIDFKWWVWEEIYEGNLDLSNECSAAYNRATEIANGILWW